MENIEVSFSQSDRFLCARIQFLRRQFAIDLHTPSVLPADIIQARAYLTERNDLDTLKQLIKYVTVFLCGDLYLYQCIGRNLGVALLERPEIIDLLALLRLR
jgi:hypothetical protein